MRTLLFRYFIYSLIIVAFAISIFLYSKAYFRKEVQHDYFQQKIIGYQFLANTLNQIPEKNWKSQLKKWDNNYSADLRIYSFQTLQQKHPQQDIFLKLNKGQPVAIKGWLQKLAPNVFSDHAKYFLPIGKTGKALEIRTNDPDLIVNYNEYWFAKSIAIFLETLPQKEWANNLKHISSSLPNWDVFINPYQVSMIPSSHRKEFIHREFSVFYNKETNHVTKIFYGFIIKGKKHILTLQRHRSDLGVYRHLLTWSILLVSLLCIIMLCVLPLQRSLKKLKSMTNHYSDGDFNSDLKVSKFSAIYSLHQDILNMGKKVKSLLQTNKDVTYGLSHELKTPMSRIHFALDTLEDTPQTEEQKSSYDSIREDVEEMENLIEQIMLYARVERAESYLKFKPEPLNRWLIDYLETWQKKLAQQNIALDINIADLQNVHLSCHKQYFEIMLNNLLSNAVKYGNQKISATIQLNKNNLVISIEDNGLGISPEHIEKALAPFNRLDNTQHIKGHGLGLNLVQKIAAWHKGTLKIDSSSLGGAKFTITLLTSHPTKPYKT